MELRAVIKALLRQVEEGSAVGARLELDVEIAALSAEVGCDQLELARLKKRKLRLKDLIARIADSNIPDIIA